MKLLGILWNSLGNEKSNAIRDIEMYSSITEKIEVDLNDRFPDFIRELYPFNEDEKWKAEYKISGLYNQYENNTITILALEIEPGEKVFLKQKNKYMYKNVLDLKVFIRRKYRHLIKNNMLEEKLKVNYDNVFHMTDDEMEYSENLPVILKYLSDKIIRHKGFLDIDKFVDYNNERREELGTRNNIWITDSLMFKEEPKGTFEASAEVFSSYVYKKAGFNTAFYDFADFRSQHGVITKKVYSNNECFFDGVSIMKLDRNISKKDQIMNNNIPTIIHNLKLFCTKHGFCYNSTIEKELIKLYIFDLLFLQPDRNPSNYGFVFDSKKRCHLVIFDNSNILLSDDETKIKLYERGSIDAFKESVCKPTFLLLNQSDNCFENKINLFRNLFLNATIEEKQIINEYLRILNFDSINSIINDIENEKCYQFQPLFKKMVFDCYGKYAAEIQNIIVHDEKRLIKK